MHRHRHQHRPAAPVAPRRHGHRLARAALGATVAVALLSAGLHVMVPFADPAWRELMAGSRPVSNARPAASAPMIQLLAGGGA